MPRWNESDIPDQTGRTALVTGATGGLGLRIAHVLAGAGARVLMTSRNAERGEKALASVSAVATDAAPELVELDLASLDSVRSAVADIRERTGDRLDLLVNNAGVMAPPLSFSDDGVELQWATNVFGPALLTWSLLPAIERVPGSRIVFVSSVAHWGGRFTPERLERDLTGEGYVPFAYYGRTKLADLLLSRELQRHFLRVGADTISLAAHPGVSATGLIDSTTAGKPDWVKAIARGSIDLLGQPAEGGALPILYAATEPGVRGSQFFGPAWVFETRGPPTRATRSPASRSDELGADLLAFIEDQIGVPAPR
jgi:protochlorophyllide reductase